MNFDINQESYDTLVARENQLNHSNLTQNSLDKSNPNCSLINSSVNSLNNNNRITSKLGNSIDNENQKDEFKNTINSIEKEKDNQLNDNLIQFNDSECSLKNDAIDKLANAKPLVDNQKINNEENINDELIEKLGLNLDYHLQTNLSELEQFTTSLTASINRSESSSVHSLKSSTNSPTRSNSQRSLPFPPKKSETTSEINLLINDNDFNSKNQDEQIPLFFAIERRNLMHLASLIINNLVNNISPITKTLECHDNIVLYDFFSIIEQILKHGLKARKGLIFGKKELWHVFESIENINSQVIEIIQNIRELPTVKTNNGRVKAFLRLAFVQKVFNEIFTYLSGCKELLNSFYEDGAFILSNEFDEFLNKTEELREFDFRWCAKEIHPKLDELSNLIDLTSYLVDKDKTTKEIVYKVQNINKNQLKELFEEKQFFENKSKEFRNKILFYHNRIKELGIESLFEGELVKSPSKIELLTKKLNEFLKIPVEKPEKSTDIQILSLREDIATLKKQLEIELSNRVSKEAALEYIESDVLVKQDENIVMRHQIDEVKQVNEELCLKVGELGQLNNDLNNKVVSLTNKNQNLVSTITELQRNLVACEAKYSQLRKQFEEITKSNDSLKDKVLQEQVEKKNLQKKLDDNIERNSTLLTELNITNNRANDYPSLKKKHDILLRRCLEYEEVMEEIGRQLKEAKLEIESLKEQSLISDAVWKNDREAKNCEACNVAFSIKIRRHHCRNCGSWTSGNVFCGKCSDRKIPLPADSKPCRVCDQCHTKLMSSFQKMGNESESAELNEKNKINKLASMIVNHVVKAAKEREKVLKREDVNNAIKDAKTKEDLKQIKKSAAILVNQVIKEVCYDNESDENLIKFD